MIDFKKHFNNSDEIDFWVQDIYPITIISDRYGGTYSGGQYTAWPIFYYDIPEGPEDSDIPCFDFWQNVDKSFIGIGESIDAAKLDLIFKMKKKLEDYEG